MSRREAPKLIGGPYAAPRFRLGRVLRCRVRGPLRVAGLTDAPIPWPYARQVRGGGRRILIVRGDLIRALRTESTSAVCWHWGVGRNAVADWKRVLEIPRQTPGARQLKRETMARHLSDADRAKGGRAAARVRRRSGPTPKAK